MMPGGTVPETAGEATATWAISAARLQHDGRVLARCLMALSPSSIDLKLCVDAAFRQHLASAAGAQRQWWFQVRTPNGTGYIYADADGSGRYQREPPDGVAAAQLITVALQPEQRPALRLLDEFLRLLGGLLAGQRIRIVGEATTLAWQGESAEHSQLIELQRVLSLTRAACADAYAEQTTREHLLPLRGQLLAHLAARVQHSTLLDLLAPACDEVRRLRAAYRADAALASWFMVYQDVLQRLAARLAPATDAPDHGAAELVRYIAFGCAGGECDPAMLTPALASKLARDGFADLVAAQAADYLERGERAIAQALDSGPDDDFTAPLYAATLDLFAARQLYAALALHTANDPNRLRLYRKSADHAEEKCVRANNALFVALQNRNGCKLAEHRQRLQQARAGGGAAAVDDVVFELIEMAYFYPRWMAARLAASPGAT